MSLSVNGTNSTTYDPVQYSTPPGASKPEQPEKAQGAPDDAVAATYEPGYPVQHVSLRRVELSAEENDKLQKSLSSFTSAKQRGLALYRGVLALYGADRPDATNKTTSPEVEAARVVKPNEYNSLKEELKNLERIYAETKDQEGWIYGVSKAYNKFKEAAGSSDTWMEAYRTAFGDHSEGSQWEQLYGRYGDSVSVKDGTEDDPLTDVFSGSKRMNLMLAPKAVHSLAFDAGNLNRAGQIDYLEIMDSSFADLKGVWETIHRNLTEKAVQNGFSDVVETEEQQMLEKTDKIAAAEEELKKLRLGASISEDGLVIYHARIEFEDRMSQAGVIAADNTNDLLMRLMQKWDNE